MPAGPTVRIDFDSPVPAYRQIVDSLRALLVEGKLPCETRLPSVRRLAMELGVHFNTVGEAYRELAAEGWIDLRHGRGATVVARAAPPRPSRERAAEFRERLRRLVAEMRAGGIPAAAIAAELRTLAGELAKS
jgi:GntR family transcriptional regulator/MocR family aminotransferase